jgi:hypothetical protein
MKSLGPLAGCRGLYFFGGDSSLCPLEAGSHGKVATDSSPRGPHAYWPHGHGGMVMEHIRRSLSTFRGGNWMPLFTRPFIALLIGTSASFAGAAGADGPARPPCGNDGIQTAPHRQGSPLPGTGPMPAAAACRLSPYRSLGPTITGRRWGSATPPSPYRARSSPPSYVADTP